MNMKKLSMGAKQNILKLKKNGKSIRIIVETLGIANTRLA